MIAFQSAPDPTIFLWIRYFPAWGMDFQLRETPSALYLTFTGIAAIMKVILLPSPTLLIAEPEEFKATTVYVPSLFGFAFLSKKDVEVTVAISL